MNGSHAGAPWSRSSGSWYAFPSTGNAGGIRVLGRPERVASADDAPFRVGLRAGWAEMTSFLAGRVERRASGPRWGGTEVAYRDDRQ
jgi:hypothetical protein